MSPKHCHCVTTWRPVTIATSCNVLHVSHHGKHVNGNSGIFTAALSVFVSMPFDVEVAIIMLTDRCHDLFPMSLCFACTIFVHKYMYSHWVLRANFPHLHLIGLLFRQRPRQIIVK